MGPRHEVRRTAKPSAARRAGFRGLQQELHPFIFLSPSGATATAFHPPPGAPRNTAAYWLLLSLRGLAPRTSFWREAQFDTIRLSLIKVAGRVTEMVTRIKVALPTAFPYQAGFADLAGRIAKLPP